MKRVFMKFRADIIRLFPVILSAFVIAWCGFYLLLGSSSVFVMRALKVQEADLQGHLTQLEGQRTQLEDKVTRLRPDSLDWDLVEQEALLKLGTPAKPDAKALPM